VSAKVLITGGAGFIGERLAFALVDDDYEVHILDNLTRSRKDERIVQLEAKRSVKFLAVDLLQPAALDILENDYDAVVHLAAIVGVQNVVDHPYQTLRDNVLIHEAVIRFAARQTNLQRVLFASTSEVYAGSLIHLRLPLPTPEDSPLALPDLSEPRTAYMLSKIYGEAMLLHSGLPYTIVRPHNVYGPRMGMAHVIPELLKKAHDAKSGGDLEVFSLDHSRCFCYIDDAVEMVRRLLKTNASRNQVLNLGVEAPEVTIKDLAEIVIATVGKPLHIAGKPATAGSPTRRVPDMTRMQKITNYSGRISLRDGIIATYGWYKAHGFSQ
jgi:nucleoside-diphosphate-sugar epimerase